MSELQAWWDTLPPVTRVLFAGGFVTTLAAGFRLVPFSYLVLDLYAVVYNFEVRARCVLGRAECAGVALSDTLPIPRPAGLRLPHEHDVACSLRRIH